LTRGITFFICSYDGRARRPETGRHPEEANLAVQYVAACEQALDCLRLARAVPNDTACILKCTAQAASMMRQARGWRTAMQRAQADRHRRQDNGAARATPLPRLSPRLPPGRHRTRRSRGPRPNPTA
jgi:hypothetical protein